MISRVVFTFILATLNGRTWHLEGFGVLPVIAFGSDTQTFEVINSTSILLSSLLVFAITFYFLFRFNRDRIHRLAAVSWVLGSLLVVIQYVVLVIIDSSDRFAFNKTIGIFIVPIAIAVLLIYGYIQKRGN